MLKVNITEDMIERAKKRADEMPNTKNAFMDHERHVVGFLGEEIFMNVFPEAKGSEDEEVYDYDFTMYTKKVELKTKMCKSIPQPNYEASIYTYFNQDPDYYFFCRIYKELDSYPYGWLLGYIPVQDFKEKSVLLKKGELQENGLVPRVNTWNVRIDELIPMDRILNNIKKIKETK